MIKKKPTVPATNSNIPASLYEKLNLEQSVYTVKEFTLEPALAATDSATTAPTTAPIRKPMFKPTFKKPTNESLYQQ